MERFNVELTESAERDLRDLAVYISSQLNAPITALEMIRLIREDIAKLETMALVYPLLRDDRLAALGYRSIRVKNYTVFYVADEKNRNVDVDRILYSRRDWQSVL